MKVFHFYFVSIVAIGIMILFINDEVLSKQDDISERIKKIEKNIDKTRRELDKEEKELKKLKSREKKILSELDFSDKKIETINKNLRIIQNEEKILKQEINSAQKNYDTAKKIIENKSEIYAERLRSMYKRQKVSPVGMFFTAGSTSAILRGLKMMTVIAAADLNVLSEIRAQIHARKSSMEKLKVALNAQISLAETNRREKNSLAKVRNKKSQILVDISNDERLREERIQRYNKELERSQAELDKFIREMEREREKAKIPVPASLEGYNFAQYKGKLPWPVNGKVVSRFGKVTDPSTKTTTNNRGVEIQTKQGEPVSSIAKGQVVMTQFFRGYGNFVVIFHPPDYYTIYGHLSDWLVNKDDIVSEGDIVGLAGTTGMFDNSSSRLVLEVLKGEKPENPLNWLRPDRQRARK